MKKNKKPTATKKARLIAAFNEMSAADKLPLFSNGINDAPETGLVNSVELDPVDMGMLRVVDFALSINNIVRMLHLAKKAVGETFPKEETGIDSPVTSHLENSITGMLAAQADTMRYVEKKAKAYTKATKARKPSVVKYEKTYSKTKVVN
jgi:hypothetical protein